MTLYGWNFNAIPDYQAIIAAAKALRSETLFTAIRPFAAIPEEQHRLMHDSLPGSHVDHPHSNSYQPIRKDLEDPDSDIVAFVVSGVAWDASMRGLLPDGVEGIHCVISNTCGQSFTYEIVGRSAIFVGDGDQHDNQYDEYEVFVDLSLAEHPDIRNVSGHCLFEMVSTAMLHSITGE